MRLSDDFHNEDNNNSFKMACAAVSAIAFVMLVFLLTVYQNQKNTGREQVDSKVHGEDSTSVNRLVSDDLEFWKDYPKKDTVIQDLEKEKTREDLRKQELDKLKKKMEQLSANEVISDNSLSMSYGVSENEVKSDSQAADGKHTWVEYQDGRSEWLPIEETIRKNDYDMNGFRSVDQVMKYDSNGRKNAWFGIDVSKYNGDIDWGRVGAAGVDFVMIRYGSRGYGSGQIIFDEKFIQNMEGAAREGIKIGIYFYSQAITKAEAIEEANYVIAGISKYKISYPIVFDTEQVSNDIARTERLSKTELTEIAKAFCDTVKAWGHTPMIYGDKEQLLTKLDLKQLSNYSIWLSFMGDKPDYPYEFSMWQYSNTGKIDGINGSVNLNISLINYAEK